MSKKEIQEKIDDNVEIISGTLIGLAAKGIEWYLTFMFWVIVACAILLLLATYMIKSENSDKEKKRSEIYQQQELDKKIELDRNCKLAKEGKLGHLNHTESNHYKGEMYYYNGGGCPEIHYQETVNTKKDSDISVDNPNLPNGLNNEVHKTDNKEVQTDIIFDSKSNSFIEQASNTVASNTVASNPTSVSFQPSFDCQKASTIPEKLICSNQSLAEADMQLYTAYETAKNIASDKASFIGVQNEWRKNVRDACTDVNCLLDVYRNRLKQLTN